ncbi:transcriptional regulator [Betaproteobacteria bacterium GR16-43]|nr:transcriptional regulator [Betaproteobacteria bacterium GR16-43]
MSLPTTRVLAVLELLQSQTQIGGAELAARVGVDRRTLRRYIATLEEMGIPITTEQGRYGGYKLVPGFKLPPMMFTDEEAQALSLGLIAARGLGLADAAPAIESVQAKLDRVLPNAPRKTIAALRESVALQTGGARANADAKLLRVLSESAQARQTASLRYRAADGALTTRDFNVFGLVFRSGRWYVVGFCHLRLGNRTLRLDRVAHAEVTERAFSRPEGFDAGEYLTKALATLPRGTAVEVLLLTDLERARREVFNPMGFCEACPEGVMLKGAADDLDWYARELMRLPFKFEVRAPTALRNALARIAREYLEAFA